MRSICFYIVLLSPLVITQGQTRVRGGGIPAAIALVSDSAIRSSVKTLESFGTRHHSSPNKHVIAEWIRESFIEAGLADVMIDSFEFRGSWQKNVVATMPGSERGFGEMIIGAHYDSQTRDSIGAPGADDNASGMAGIIEIARVLRATDFAPRATVRFVAFAAEEAGLVGSAVYADRLLNEGRRVSLMQNYDMIGYRDQAQSDRNVNINVYSNAIAEAVLDSIVMRTYTTLTPILTTSNISRSDSWPFAVRFMKAVFVIEHDEDFNPYYHSSRDSSTYLDFTYAAEIVQSAIALTMIYDSSGMSGMVTPTTYALYPNFPNPFNASTQITYELPERSHVLLEIYDVLGRRVAVLEDAEVDGGTYMRPWLPDGAGGVYLSSLRVLPVWMRGKNIQLTQKMLFVK